MELDSHYINSLERFYVSGVEFAPVEASYADSLSIFSAAKNSPPERLKQLRRPGTAGVSEKTEPLYAKPPHGRFTPTPSPSKR
jgi:hypothetical protein